MALYKLLDNGYVSKADCGTTIPNNTLINEWGDYQKWLAAGNTPDPVDPPPPPSQDEVDAQAARQYIKLHALSLMTPDQVKTWVASNVTTLAQAQDAIATIAIAIAVLARRI